MNKRLDLWLAPFGISAPALTIADIRIDSRQVMPSDLFVATQGLHQNGEQFIAQAIERGAIEVMVDSESKVSSIVVPVIKVANLTNQLAQLLGAFYGGAQTIKKVGITGTNGKTTISQLIAQMGEMLQIPTAVIGTMGAGHLSQLVEMPNTTPGIADNYRLLDQFSQQGDQWVAMEVSSQGLAQGRVTGIDFDSVIFSNLSQDHLDYHGDMRSYAEAKKSLFDLNPQVTQIINIDDPCGKAWFGQWQHSRKLVAVGQWQPLYDNSDNDWRYAMFDNIEQNNTGLAFSLLSSWGRASVKTSLFGHFNLYNLVSAMAFFLDQGVTLDALVAAVANVVAVPGRMEQFACNGVVAIVDYAHTPDALSQSLQAARAHANGQLWCIFGCGGDRDKGKRPLMAQMAQRFADHVVLTNDNPRNEQPQQIVEDILSGFEGQQNVTVELDRKQAIVSTLAAANNGDIVLIAGKGHETYQIFGDDVINYDERSFVQQYISQNSEEMAS